MSNILGERVTYMSFGESHGPAVGAILDGISAGIDIDCAYVQRQVDRRKPAAAAGGTARRESDEVEILSGIYRGKTLGTPIGILIRNNDARHADYASTENLYRPNHADYTWQARYGHRDHRGGGRASARETGARVAAGAIASQVLATAGVRVKAWTQAIGSISTGMDPATFTGNQVYESPLRCPDRYAAESMRMAISQAREQHDTLGGIVACSIHGVPAGVGDPIFGKLQAKLGAAMLSIPAVKGFEYGDGFAAAESCGSAQADIFIAGHGTISTATNHSGGIQGGISNGMPIVLRVAFKPIATMPGRTVDTVDTAGETASLTFGGRHDVCCVPRAVPVVEAMASLAILDAMATSGRI